MRRASPVFVLILLLPSVMVVAPSGSASGVPASCLDQTNVDVALVMDRSGSMVDHNRMTIAKTAATQFLATLKPTDQSALISFASNVRMDRNLTTQHTGAAPSTTHYVNALVPNTGTQIWMGIRMAHFELVNQGPFGAGFPYSGNAGAFGGRKVMIVLSDGDQNSAWPTPEEEADRAKAAGVMIFSIALGNNISPSGLLTMRNIATSPDHFFRVLDGDPLGPVFDSIAVAVRDVSPPTVQILRPVDDLYHNDVSLGASPIAAPAIAGPMTPAAAATDDCILDRVEFEVLVHDDADVWVGNLAAGVDTTAPFEGAFDCDQLVGGRHVLRVTAFDAAAKRTSVDLDFHCIRAAVDARATAMYTRLTNPVGPNVSMRGAHLPTTIGGTDESLFANRNGATPFPYDVSLLYDWVEGGRWGATDAQLEAEALSRLTNLTLAPAGRYDVIETRASVLVDGVPRPGGFDVSVQGSTRGVSGAVAEWYPDGTCETRAPTVDEILDVPNGGGIQSPSRCVGRVFVADGVEVRFDERIYDGGVGWASVTVNGVHVLVERPEGRAELILSQSFAAASVFGKRGLPLSPERALDRQDDAGSGGDASDARSTAVLHEPGTYSGRIAGRFDVDAYGVHVEIGEKVHALLVPSAEVRATLGPAPSFSDDTDVPSLRMQLLDPHGNVRDDKFGFPVGLPFQVELNVDVPGTWVVRVHAMGNPGDYTLRLSVTPAPTIEENDALLGADAPDTCADASLVGPGVHVGALEDADASDFYRVRVSEGQGLAVVLRPGDTPESTAMGLYVYDPECRVIANGIPPTSTTKGMPRTVTLGVGVLGQGPLSTGLYRIEVRHANGLGTYELAVTTTVATQP